LQNATVLRQYWQSVSVCVHVCVRVCVCLCVCVWCSYCRQVNHLALWKSDVTQSTIWLYTYWWSQNESECNCSS